MLIRLSRFGKDLREPLDELELGRDLAALVGDLLLRSETSLSYGPAHQKEDHLLVELRGACAVLERYLLKESENAQGRVA